MNSTNTETFPRERISLSNNWRFYRYGSADQSDDLIYDVRPEVKNSEDDRAADARPTEAVKVEAARRVLKTWILPTGNGFIKDLNRRHTRPEGDPGSDFPFVQAGFDDSSWESVKLPHDWAIQGPLLPHWTWPERVGQVTPVHVFTSGDEAELFLNGRSLGRKKKGQYEYRLRWDDILYEPGELKVAAYRDGKQWAENVVRTTGEPARLELSPIRSVIGSDGLDLSFVTVRVLDREGRMVPRAKNPITFAIEGPGNIVATDNSDPTNLVPFPSHERVAFNGLCLAIVRGKPGQSGTITIRAESGSLQSGSVSLMSAANKS